jgi:hypothetical protein
MWRPAPLPSAQAVELAVAAMSAAFVGAPRPVHMEACPCCAGRVDLPRLLSTPPAELSGEDLLPYALKAITTIGGTAELVWFTPRLLTLQLDDALGVDDELLLGKLGLGDLRGWAARLRDAVLAVLGAELARRLAYAPEAVDAWLCGLVRATGDLQPWLDAVDGGPLGIRSAARRFRAWARRAGAIGRSAFWHDLRAARALAEAWVAREGSEVLVEDPGYFMVVAEADDSLTLLVDRERGAGVVETRERRLTDAEAAAVWAGDAAAARALADELWW